MQRGIIITLEPWEYFQGFVCGIGRLVSNWNRPDASHYNTRAMEENRNAQPAAALCELAVAKYLNQYWHGSVWTMQDHSKYRHLPDVGTNIEVRRVRTRNGITIRNSDAGMHVWGARCVDSEYREIEILGFVVADDYLPIKGKSLVVPFAELTKPWEEDEKGRPARKNAS